MNDEKIILFYKDLAKSKPLVTLDTRHINGGCTRKTWSRLRCIAPSSEEINSLRREALTQQLTPLLLEECRALGWTVHEQHPKTHDALEFKHDSFTLKVTALARDNTQTIQGWFLLEVGIISPQQWEKINSKGFKACYKSLYTHCQLAMGLSHIPQCMVYLCTYEGQVWQELIQFNDEDYQEFLLLSHRLYHDNTPPDAVESSQCGSCSYHKACYDESFIPNIVCQTCIYAKFQNLGIYCNKWQRDIATDVWRDGCAEHVFLPELLKFAKKKQVIQSDNSLIIEYALQNGEVFKQSGEKNLTKDVIFTSQELSQVGAEMLENPLILSIKQEFLGSKITSKETS